MSRCPFCEIKNFDSRMVQEFEHGFWVLAENQHYKGYSILISKQHVRERHNLPENIAISLNQNLREIASKIQETFHAHKMNLASFGNLVEHLHWHIVPRYLSDPHHLEAPQLGMPGRASAKDFQQLKKMLVKKPKNRCLTPEKG